MPLLSIWDWQSSMKAEVRVCFYSSARLQGWRKYCIGLMQWTPHTHVHLELRFTAYKLILMTVDGGKPRSIRLGLNKNLFNVAPYAEVSFGILQLKDLDWLLTYPETRAADLIWYQILSYFGKQDKENIPPTCSTFVVDFLNRHLHYTKLPRLFSPKQLWRYLYDGNNDWRQRTGG